MEILKLEKVTKVYHSKGSDLTVLDSIDLSIKTGSTVSIVGPSGSGKTTLLSLCAGLDLPTRGQIQLNDQFIDSMSEEERAMIRNLHIGFVFQNFQLIPTLTALENVCIPLELRNDRQAKAKAAKWLDRVGLGDRASHYPVQLSGGEQQRVAIARASVNEPKILFADEPTGNLDEETSAAVESVLFEAHRETGNTLIIVTHDLDLAQKTNEVIRLRKGKLES